MYRMRASLLGLMSAFALSLLTSCAHERLWHERQDEALTGVVTRFAKLKEAGRLPGIGADEHGHLVSEPLSRSDPAVYPISVVLRVTKSTMSRNTATSSRRTATAALQTGDSPRLGAD